MEEVFLKVGELADEKHHRNEEESIANGTTDYEDNIKRLQDRSA